MNSMPNTETRKLETGPGSECKLHESVLFDQQLKRVVIPSEAGRLFFRSHGERRLAQSRNLLFLANSEGING
jgi:hypothetical protein